MTINELDIMRYMLEEKMEKEFTKLCRLYRKAVEHGCSEKLLKEIRDERYWMYSNKAYPDRILHPEFKYRHRLAFRIA